jgi:hypothetical protein
MTQVNAPVPTAGSPVAEWVLATPGDTRLALEKVVMRANTNDQRTRPLRTLGAVARRALVEEIEAKLRMLMSETVVDLIAGGWRTYGAVAQAIRKSRSQPGVDQIVPLHNHTIKGSCQHDLDIEVDSVPVMTLSVELAVRVQLCDAVAVVRDEHLVAARSGQAKAEGTVSVDGVVVARRTLVFPLTAELALHSQRRTYEQTHGGSVAQTGGMSIPGNRATCATGMASREQGPRPNPTPRVCRN